MFFDEQIRHAKCACLVVANRNNDLELAGSQRVLPRLLGMDQDGGVPRGSITMICICHRA
ncbi:hypothetical protein M404DRAFT_1004550 [Pisolithus tinctorius Marx 270]|uniref:Uncharacterized protein n=1 Tax=Pisolithus tinctorius Marx 270 TaxID=870435 RepID=A0A0C3NEW0_PISTI|nr:hypothetical protein M404DRAFT_1004550 [Pisolithus tinctorius Marx 270]